MNNSHSRYSGNGSIPMISVYRIHFSDLEFPANSFYDACNLLEETDAEGTSTHYSYNDAGQKIREETSGRITTFGYDPLGFLNRIEKGGRITTIQNDFLGRPLEKTTSGYLKTSFSYDSSGNTASITKRGTTYFCFDPYNRLIEQTDPLGNQTTITYTEGDRSLIKKIIDPRGIITVEYYDPHDCLLKKEVDGVLTQENAYNSDLRKSRQDHLTFTYTPDGYLASMTEAGTEPLNILTRQPAHANQTAAGRSNPFL